MAIYRDRIESAIKVLLTSGFCIENAVESEKHFGDTIITLTGKVSKLQFLSDRGQLFVSIAERSSSTWQDLRDALDNIGAQHPAGPWPSAIDAVQAIQEHRNELSLS